MFATGSVALRITSSLTRRFLQTESKNIIVTSAANKIPGSLSFGLDGTLKSGHNMRVFGLGTAAALANRGRYSRFTHVRTRTEPSTFSSSCSPPSSLFPLPSSPLPLFPSTIRRATSGLFDPTLSLSSLTHTVAAFLPSTNPTLLL